MARFLPLNSYYLIEASNVKWSSSYPKIKFNISLNFIFVLNFNGTKFQVHSHSFWNLNVMQNLWYRHIHWYHYKWSWSLFIFVHKMYNCIINTNKQNQRYPCEKDHLTNCDWQSINLISYLICFHLDQSIFNKTLIILRQTVSHPSIRLLIFHLLGRNSQFIFSFLWFSNIVSCLYSHSYRINKRIK